MQVDLREFRAAYLAEVDEHLSAINGLLLAIDAASITKKSSPRDLRELMRLLHTLKGLSAMVGIEPIVTLSHHMETLIRAADRAGGFLSAGALELLIDGTRAIESRVRSVANDQPALEPPSSLLAALDNALGIADANATANANANATANKIGNVDDPVIVTKLTASEREQIAQGASDGLRVVSVEFSPSHAKAERGQTITTVRERLRSVGEIVRVLPIARPPTSETPHSSAGGGGGLVFVLIVLTDASDDAIAEASSIPCESIRDLASSFSSSSSSPDKPEDGCDDGDGGGGRGEDELLSTQLTRPGVLRVEVGRIDDAIDKLSGLIVTRARLAHGVASLRRSGVNTRELEVIVADNARQLRDLRGAILRLRMVPITSVLDRLPLIIRGLGKTTGKRVRLVLDSGGGAELDKTVAERIFPALVHVLRNAVDHGIENEEDRVRAGKPPQGTITVSSSARNNRQIEIRIHDDGRGLDRKRIVAKARRDESETGTGTGIGAGIGTSFVAGDNNILDEHDDVALLALVCRPGLSTRDQIDTTSGRGVGMDIVHKIVVDGLGGDLALETSVGRGTTFVLRVPLTIAIVDAFSVRCAGERFVVPVPVVEEIIELDATRVVRGPRAHGQETRLFAHRGETVPIIDLASALGLVAKTSPLTTTSSVMTVGAHQQALVVRRGYDEPVAFAIDRILGQQETVVRPLVDPLVSVLGVSGSTDLGDGRATLVLDLLALSAELGRHRGGSSSAARTEDHTP